MAKIGEAHHRRDFLLKDVMAIELSLAPEHAAQFRKLMTETFGYRLTGNTATGPGIRITVDNGAPPQGIRSVTFSLQNPVPSDINLAIGNSKLHLSARGQAVWTFVRA